MSFTSLAKAFTIASIALLFCKSLFAQGIKFDVIFVILSALCIIIALIRKEFVLRAKLLPVAIALIVAFCATALGSILSVPSLHDPLVPNVLLEYRILIGCILVFTEIVILGFSDEKFLEYSVLAFLPSLIVIFLPYLPTPLTPTILQGSNRFSGFLDANFYPVFMILPTIILFYFLSKIALTKYKILLAILLFTTFSLSIGLIMWSGTRSGWIGLIVAVLIFIGSNTINSLNKIKQCIILSILFISAVFIGHAMLPENAKSDIKQRVEFITTAPPPAQQDNTVKTIPLIDSVSHNQDRLSLWRQSLGYIKNNPLGYGLNYSAIINIDNSHSGAHSLPLELLLTGGFLLLGSLGYLLWIGLRGTPKTTTLQTVALASLIGLLASMMFLSGFLIRWLWVEVAILVAWQLNKQSKL